MPIKAIVMDFGNTLVDYPLIDWNSQIEFIKAFLAEYGKKLPVCRQYSIAEMAVQLNTENDDRSVWRFVERVRSPSFFGDSLRISAARDFEKAICQAVFDRAMLFQDSLESVTGLRESGYQTGIVSNLPWGTSSTIWRTEISRHGFNSKLIDQIVCCVDVGYRKPHPAALRECVARLGCEPEEVVYVGDAIGSDVQAALAVGCLPVLLDRGDTCQGYVGFRVRAMWELRFILKELENRPFSVVSNRTDFYPTPSKAKRHRRAMAAGAKK